MLAHGQLGQEEGDHRGSAGKYGAALSMLLCIVAEPSVAKRAR